MTWTQQLDKLPTWSRFQNEWPLLSEALMSTEDPDQVTKQQIQANVLADIEANADNRQFLLEAEGELDKWADNQKVESALRNLFPAISGFTEQFSDIAVEASEIEPTLSDAVDKALVQLDNSANDAASKPPEPNASTPNTPDTPPPASKDEPVDQESAFMTFMTDNVAGLPTWAWFAIGFGALLLVIVIIVAMSGAKKNQGLQSFRQPPTYEPAMYPGY